MTKDKKVEIAKWLLDPDKRFELPNDWNFLEKKLNENSLKKVFEEIEIPLWPILNDVKGVGIKVDKDKLIAISAKLTKKSEEIQKDIYKKIGKEFSDLNLNSPKQLSHFLFDLPPVGLGLKDGGVSKTKSGNFSVDVNTLTLLYDQHPIVPLLIKYREISKIQSTYIEPLKNLADQNSRVHTTFLQMGAATGRFSSRDPNLQNVPKEIRDVFVSEKGCSLVAIDYSQIELRILASVSSDQKMIEAFRKGIDIHALTASQILNKDINKITPKERNFAKTLNFGIVYGMGPLAFAKAANLDINKAREFINGYFKFSEIKRYQEKIISSARQLGYVENLNGRKRWVPDIISNNFRARKEAERAVINMPIQGLAADIIKLAMIKVANVLKLKKLWMTKVRLLLTIHDELLFEISDDILHSIIPVLQTEMEAIYKLKVPLIVNVSLGKRWGALRNF